jgi:FlaG/FlaF family flagellin (archaellin)
MNGKYYILLIALAVIMTAIFCTFILNKPNCYQIEYQTQTETKHTTVCEGDET